MGFIVVVHTMPSPEQWTELSEELVRLHFHGDMDYLGTSQGEGDLLNHLQMRGEKFARLYLPWITSLIPLRGARVLEIGSGTGCSTLVLAQAGAQITALDISRDALSCCKTRLAIHGLHAEQYIVGNVTDSDLVSDDSFDIICFWASLEHMTTKERMASLRAAWSQIRSGGLLIVIECPNRLWYFDDHSSLLPFWMWLPDDLAILYWKHRKIARAPENAEDLARCGRGASYHEFELSGLPVHHTDEISSLQLFTRKNNLLKILKWSLTRKGRYSRQLNALQPDIHQAFFQPYLDVALKKP